MDEKIPSSNSLKINMYPKIRPIACDVFPCLKCKTTLQVLVTKICYTRTALNNFKSMLLSQQALDDCPLVCLRKNEIQIHN